MRSANEEEISCLVSQQHCAYCACIAVSWLFV
nr:MAG TPA: hypothetical protein [Caudoviricetes sp.]